jgi:hypothetical protein
VPGSSTGPAPDVQTRRAVSGRGRPADDSAGDTAGDSAGDTAGDTAGDSAGDSAGDTADDTGAGPIDRTVRRLFVTINFIYST